MNEILVNENISVRKAFNVMEAVSLHGAIICALKETRLQPAALCSCAASLSECDVWYDAAPKLLSCRCSEAHVILFLLLVFHLCLPSAGRVFTLLFGLQSWSEEVGRSLVSDFWQGFAPLCL